MNVLWITPNILPAPFRYDQKKFRTSGGWLGSLAEIIKRNPEIDLHVISISKLAEYPTTNIGNITYHAIPSNKGVFKYSSVLTNQLKLLVQQIHPDIIDFQGLEFSYVQDIIEISSGLPTCATLQGLVSEISKYYLSSMSILDVVSVPSNLPPGKYVLGWRYDCEATAQVWSNCADIEIR